jgi:hypothetical protein
MDEKRETKTFRMIVRSRGQQKSVGTFVFEISFYRQRIMAAKQARYLYYYHVILVLLSSYRDGI